EMRVTLLAEIAEMVKSSEKITVSRYNELSKIADDQEKLTAANATEDELAILKEVQDKKDAGTARINDAFKNLAKEYVGATAYNKIRKALKEEPEVKSKYETLLEELVLRLDFGFFFERFADLVIGSGAYVFFRKVLEGIVNAGRAGIFLILYFLQDGQFIFGGVCCRKLFLVVSYF